MTLKLTLERAAWMLDSYVAYLRDAKPADLERHPYLPEMEEISLALQALAPTQPQPCWTCFHCGESFFAKESAEAHFGPWEESEPACKIKAGAEGSILRALRDAEGAAAEAWAKLHNESCDFAKAYHTQSARHRTQLQHAEELGYERGLADGNAHPVQPASTLPEASSRMLGPHAHWVGATRPIDAAQPADFQQEIIGYVGERADATGQRYAHRTMKFTVPELVDMGYLNSEIEPLFRALRPSEDA